MTDMNRIEARMNACSKKQEKAFITYITAGLPDLAATKEIIRAQERSGCDVMSLACRFPIRWRTDRSSRTHRTVQSAAG